MYGSDGGSRIGNTRYDDADAFWMEQCSLQLQACLPP